MASVKVDVVVVVPSVKGSIVPKPCLFSKDHVSQGDFPSTEGVVVAGASPGVHDGTGAAPVQVFYSG